MAKLSIEETNSIILNLYCALESDYGDHIAHEPNVLSCGHLICKSCKVEQAQETKCRICGMINERDLAQKQETPFFNILLNQNINKLFELIKEWFGDCIDSYVNNVLNINEKLEEQIEFAKYEVDIRVESLKNDLDNLGESIKKELNQVKDKWKTIESKTHDLKRFYQNELNSKYGELIEDIKNERNMDKVNLYDYQMKIIDLRKCINDFKCFVPKVLFESKDTQFDGKLIGQISYNFDEQETNIFLKRMEHGKYEKTKIEGHTISDICCLPNKNIVIASKRPSCLLLYDENMKFINKIDRIDDQVFQPCSVDTNGTDSVYLSDNELMTIIKADLDLTSFYIYSNESSYTFKSVSGICFSNNCLFVCDRDNHRVQKFNSELTHQATYILKIRPCLIKIINNTACILSYFPDSICFYDINNFQLKRKYDEYALILGALNSKFCYYCDTDKTIQFYDKNGNKLKQISTTIPTHNNRIQSGCFTKATSKFILALTNSVSHQIEFYSF